MGFGKSLKKVAKSVKNVVKNPVGTITGAAAGAGTGFLVGGPVGAAVGAGIGAAGAATVQGASEYERISKVQDAEKEQRKADLVAKNTRQYGWGSMAEVVEARRKKQQQLAESGEGQATGLASLIGKGKTLG